MTQKKTNKGARRQHAVEAKRRIEADIVNAKKGAAKAEASLRVENERLIRELGDKHNLAVMLDYESALEELSDVNATLLSNNSGYVIALAKAVSDQWRLVALTVNFAQHAPKATLQVLKRAMIDVKKTHEDGVDRYIDPSKTSYNSSPPPFAPDPSLVWPLNRIKEFIASEEQTSKGGFYDYPSKDELMAFIKGFHAAWSARRDDLAAGPFFPLSLTGHR